MAPSTEVRPPPVKVSRKAPAYATLLALNANDWDVAASIELVDASNNEFTIDGIKYTNDASIARFVARTGQHSNDIFGDGIVEQLQIERAVVPVEAFLEFGGDVNELMKSVIERLKQAKWLVLDRVTLADLVNWAVIANHAELQKGPLEEYFNRILHDERFAEAHHIAAMFKDIPALNRPTNQHKAKPDKSKAATNGQGKEKTKDEGKFVELPGAEKGNVVVRFPPEASGYLHIGHAKAALLNQYYQQAFEGQLIFRFDDTNPAKENAHFEKVILEDLAMLNVKPDQWTHSSDHFEFILEQCEKLLKESNAYVDDTDTDTMRKEREERKESRNRNNSVKQNWAMWEEMKQGSTRGQECCVRIKMDMSSNNGAMRDPTIYRCKNEPHVRTGDKYKVYPTYDFTCPIVDSREGVTHSLRTTEYADRDEQFYFICDKLALRKPHIWSYARLNMTNTVMSKRKLTWFVDEHVVEGWNDPRLPTVRGVMRRGLTVEGLKQFIVAQGGSRSIVTMEWDKIWSFNKKVIDPVAPRYTALSVDEPLVPVMVEGQSTAESKHISVHPKRTDIGEKQVWYSSKVFVEAADARDMKPGDTVTFINWGNLKIVDVKKDGKGAVTSIQAHLDLDNKDYKKTLKVTWIAEAAQGERIAVKSVHYDHIISKPIVGKDEDWKQYINYDSAHFSELSGEPALKNVKKGDIIQIQRKGFFICDAAFSEKSAFSGIETPVVLISIPDGSKQAGPTSGSSSKAKQTTAASSTGSGDAIEAEIVKQGDVVRQSKAKDPKSAESKAAIAKLLELKKKYKETTGSDYKPKPAGSAPQATSSATSEDPLEADIAKQGDLVRELKTKDPKSAESKAAIAKLLELKKQYKEKTGHDFKPKPATPAPVASTAGDSTADALEADIVKQGDLVRQFKTKDPKSAESKASIAKLLDLKKQYKEKTGHDYKPKPVAPAPTSGNATGGSTDALEAEITKQGLIVREVKAKDPKSEESKAAIAKLLDLKKQYKEKTGHDFKPKPAAPDLTSGNATGGSADAMEEEITKQGLIVREVKAKDPKSEESKAAIAKLLDLKKQYKEKIGHDYKPKPAAPVPTSGNATGGSADALEAEITKQGLIVREVKAKDPKSDESKAAIAKLLDLKKQYKEMTGHDFKPKPAAAPVAVDESKAAIAKLLDLRNQYKELTGHDFKSEPSATTVPVEESKAAIAKLLDLRKQYKELTGHDYKPEPAAAPVPVAASVGEADALETEIAKQGNLVRELKSKDGKSAESKAAIVKLLEMKKQFKEATGRDYKPKP